MVFEAKLEFCRILDSVMRWTFALGFVVRDHRFAPKGWSGAWGRTTNRPASLNRSNSGFVCFTVNFLPGVILLMVFGTVPSPVAVLCVQLSSRVS